MRNIVYALLVLFVFSGCSDSVNYRVRTKDSMILNIEQQKIPIYKVGDEIQLQKNQLGHWVIDEDPARFQDTLYYLEGDSIVGGWIIHKKTAIIEEIIVE